MSQMISACADSRAPSAPDLERLRAEIDRIDEALLGLIEQRLAKAGAIAALKVKEQPNCLRLRPDRERNVLDRISRRAGSLPEPAVRTIWRELMGLSLQAQSRTEIVLCAPHRPILIADAARLRFGCQAPMLAAENAEEALDRARTNEAVAVIELSPLCDWWVALVACQELTIFDCLEDIEGRVVALLVGRVSRNDSGAEPAYPILKDAALRRRMGEGEPIRPLAISGEHRLCMIRSKPVAVEPSR
ncbi:MAG: chorismate mutase [Pseudomonadota bacterium]|nr:chorismate mutase [Pseudomonadota bacterium]